MLNSDLIGVAMEACEELLSGIDKLKIMMYLRASEDCPIFNSAQEVFLENSPGEKYLCSRRLREDNSTEVLFTDKDEVTFEQKVSIAQKHIDSARYDITTRFIQLLISSIGTAVEDYIIKNIPRVNNKDLNKTFYRKSTIFSPELYDELENSYKLNDPDVSYRLKDNESVIVNCDSPPMFVVIEDILSVNKVAEATEITAQLKLRFNLEGISLCLTEEKND